ncbi:MAG: ABC transporter permease [Actinomycetota bacterium]|nr:ABC transporter permease [Actinomycetota bacterium]
MIKTVNMAGIGKPIRAGNWNGASYGIQVLLLSKRSLQVLVLDRKRIILSLLQPLVMLLLFSQVFSGMFNGMMGFADTSAGLSYINYLLPAILIITGIGSAPQSGVGLVADMENGVLARFRSLPTRTSAVLLARSISDLARPAAQLVLMAIAAVPLFNFSPAGGMAGVLGSLLLALTVTWSLIWIFLALGAWLRSAENIQTVGFFVFFPLMFASGAFAPTESLPVWLRVVTTINPMTYAVEASRKLTLALPAGDEVLAALTASAALTMVAVFVATRAFRRASP